MVTTGGLVGFLAGPSLIGLISEKSDLSKGFLLLVFLTITAASAGWANKFLGTTKNHLKDAGVPQEELLAKAKTILELINTKAPVAVAKCIESANAVFDETKNGYEVEINSFGDCFATDDMKEGTTAFLEKRKAVFTGK